MLLKEIGRKIAQAFRLARAADEKVASSIAAALDAKAEQIKEYEKRFEPEHPEPEPLPMQQVIQSLAAYGFSTDEAACAIAKAMAQKPKPLRNLTNNWRKMHGLPMHRKPASFRRRRKGNGTGKQSKYSKAVDRAAILQTPWRVVQKTRAVLQPERRDAI